MTHSPYTLWSYRKLSLYEQCPERFYRTYILKEKVKENQRKFLEGAVLHFMAEMYINSEKYKENDKDWLLAQIDPAYNAWLKDIGGRNQPLKLKKNETVEKLKRKIAKYATNLASYFKSEELGKKRIESEVEISFQKVNDVIFLTGMIDLVIWDGDEIDVVDIKTVADRKYLSKDQMLIYALLCYLKYKKWPRSLAFYDATKNEIVEVPYTRDEIKLLVSKLMLYSKVISEGKYRRRELSACWGCPHKQLCDEEHERDAKNGFSSFRRSA